MSERLQSGSGSSAMSNGVRSMAKALLISLAVHTVLVGIFWRLASNVPPFPQRDIRVELTASAQVKASDVTANVPAAEKSVSAAATSQRPAEQASRAPSRVARRALRTPAPVANDPIPSTEVTPAEAPPTAAPQTAQHDGLPIDLRVLDWLARYRTYPFAARRARLEGVVQLRVTLLPDGRLVDARVEQSSGHAVLDQAALDLLARAAPLPSEFGSARTEQIELQLPIVYRMRASST